MHASHALSRYSFSERTESKNLDALPKIKIGIAAMDKKARSQPMQEIISRLTRFGEFDVDIFGDQCILERPVDQWPACDCLLSWHSEGFPLRKAQQYHNLHRPFLVNDVFMQDLLLDRRKVYKQLQQHNIPVPNHIVVNRDKLPTGTDPPGFIEEEDYVEVDGERIHKPFVEKPVSGEDHNIYIYYPHSMGGGVKKLFRKVDDKSSLYDPDHPGLVRRDGSYIYEEFLPTGGTDVKVYTVGTKYAHAEARKSPVVDGRVLRMADGKELRYPVLLSLQEKEVARMVALAFNQRVCGFDLLRSAKGKSYVCDVNGWSFVKNSKKYYEDAAGILREIILGALAPHRLTTLPPLSSMPNIYEDDQNETGLSKVPSLQEVYSINSTTNGHEEEESRKTDDRSSREELRCVLAVVRHGDRTPKQKMKLCVTQQSMLALFHKHKDSKGRQAKLKSPNQLQELLDVTRQLLQHHESGGTCPDSTDGDDTAEDLVEKLKVVRTVLEQGGQFSGINRKAQIKPERWRTEPDGRVLEAAKLILKWGGILTHAGRQQAEELGRKFRTVMYPRFGSAGGGLLRLHSTYRHDLKIYSSDEGRVQTSAAAFTKGLLDLEGTSLTPILVSLVQKDAGMLDAFGKGASEDIQKAKKLVYQRMTNGTDRSSSSGATPCASPPLSPKLDHRVSFSNYLTDMSPLRLHGSWAESDADSDGYASGRSEVDRPDLATIPIRNMPEKPLLLLKSCAEMMGDLVQRLHKMCQEADGPGVRYSSLSQAPKEWRLDANQPCSGEPFTLMHDRWQKLLKSFYNPKKDLFDISKIPDIYDSAKYDAIHNAHLDLPRLDELYQVAKTLADAVIPNEYGVDSATKLRIGSKICAELLSKLLCDMASMINESLQTMEVFEPSDVDDPRAYMCSSPAMDKPAPPRCKSMDDLIDGEFDDRSPGDKTAEESETMVDDATHRLYAEYANDINSPLRHVRTRIYFTSESHIHGLANCLRYGHERGASVTRPLVCPEGQKYLDETQEFDYLTHIVMRMYEDKSVALDDPQRFRVELLFSPGANTNPLEVPQNHVLPVLPRVNLHEADGVSMAHIAEVFGALVDPRKPITTYANMVAGARPNTLWAESRTTSMLNRDLCSPLSSQTSSVNPAGLSTAPSANLG